MGGLGRRLARLGGDAAQRHVCSAGQVWLRVRALGLTLTLTLTLALTLTLTQTLTPTLTLTLTLTLTAGQRACGRREWAGMLAWHRRRPERMGTLAGSHRARPLHTELSRATRRTRREPYRGRADARKGGKVRAAR